MSDADQIPPPLLSKPAAQPLIGKTVMLTRAPAQSAEMAGRLEQLGAAVIYCPTIQMIEPTSWEDLDAAINRLNSYDWLIFTSAKGVEFFFRRLAEKRSDGLSTLSSLRICVVGPATARAIEAAGARVDLTARESKAEGVLAAIIEQLGGEDKVARLRFLLPRARVAREVLPVELTRLGAHIDAVEAYQTIQPDVDCISLRQNLTENRIDAITFTSPSTVTNFAALIGTNDLSECLRGILVASIGPVTTEALQAHGITNVVQPLTYAGAALVEALAKALVDSDRADAAINDANAENDTSVDE